MIPSAEIQALRNSINDFDKRIEIMHLEFQKYHQGIEHRLPEWERLEMELLHFSRTGIQDLELSRNLEKVQYKFQNRKKIWKRWVEEAHHAPAADETGLR